VTEQGGLQECWRGTQNLSSSRSPDRRGRSCTGARSRETCRSASSDGAVQEQVTEQGDLQVMEQGDLQERSGSVQRWLTSILAIFRWELKERGDRSDGAVPRAGSP
jgi:hypothetical protein